MFFQSAICLAASSCFPLYLPFIATSRFLCAFVKAYAESGTTLTLTVTSLKAGQCVKPGHILGDRWNDVGSSHLGIVTLH